MIFFLDYLFAFILFAFWSQPSPLLTNPSSLTLPPPPQRSLHLGHSPNPGTSRLNKTRHIFSHWGPARQPGRGRGSNRTEKSQRQPMLYLLGDPRGNQAAHLLQMCMGLGLAPICSLVAGPVSVIPRMNFFKALGAPTMCWGLVPVSKVMIYVCQWNSRFPKIIHWHSYSK